VGRSSLSRMVHPDLEARRLDDVNLWQLSSNLWTIDVAVDSLEWADLEQIVHKALAGEVPGSE